jgi:hypothetical protein
MFAVEGPGKDLAWIEWGACMAVALAVAQVARAAWNSAMRNGSRARRARWAAAICWVLATTVCIGVTWLLRCRLGVFADRSEAYIDFCARLAALVAWSVSVADLVIAGALFVSSVWRARMANEAIKAG